MKRFEIDQRCTCAMCTGEEARIGTPRNATCSRNGCLLLVLNWNGVQPLETSTCPGCGHRVELIYAQSASSVQEPVHA